MQHSSSIMSICSHVLFANASHRANKMVGSLLTPYEGRGWTQTIGILVRLWRGTGFAYRHSHLPHPTPPKPPPPSELARASLLRASPLVSSVASLLAAKRTRSQFLTFPLYFSS